MTEASQVSFGTFASRVPCPSPCAPKPLAQARAEFGHRGESIAEWARSHGFTRSLVYEVLAGRKKCLRGDSHRIAVLLGLKRGQIVNKRADRPMKEAV